MDLEALLGELRGNVLRDDAEIASGPDDSLWSDETLVRYINDAQQQFARRTLALRDNSTPQVVEVALAAGIASYALHKSVLAVVSAAYDTDTTDLARAGHSVFRTYAKEDPAWLDPSTAATWTPGRPRAYSTDETLDSDSKGSVTMVVYPTPTSTEEGKIIHLRVARLPLRRFDIETMDAECELEEDYQLDMLEWAAFRALMNSDIDGHKTEAKDHEARFMKATRDVRRDLMRKMRAPIRFQFGRNGFTW